MKQVLQLYRVFIIIWQTTDVYYPEASHNNPCPTFIYCLQNDITPQKKTNIYNSSKVQNKIHPSHVKWTRVYLWPKVAKKLFEKKKIYCFLCDSSQPFFFHLKKCFIFCFPKWHSSRETQFPIFEIVDHKSGIDPHKS